MTVGELIDYLESLNARNAEVRFGSLTGMGVSSKPIKSCFKPSDKEILYLSDVYYDGPSRHGLDFCDDITEPHKYRNSGSRRVVRVSPGYY